MLPYQIHATVNSLALLFFLVGVYYARKHRLKLHHTAVYTGAGLLTLGVAYMLYTVGGVPSSHGRFGLFTYFIILTALATGFLFRGRRLRREHHRFATGLAIALLVVELIYGLSLVS